MTRTTLLILIAAGVAAAQSKPTITPADYGKWETLGGTVLSPDGKWLAAPIRRSNGTFELRLHPVAGGAPKVAAFGTEPAFSSDSHWAAYAIGKPEAEEDKLKKAKKPVQNRLGIMELSGGTTSTVDDVQSFAFSDHGAFVAFRRYAPQRTPPAEGAPAPDPAGSPLTIRNLQTGADTTFGNVTSFAWQEKGTHLAMTIGVEGREGNSVQVYDPANGELKVLDSGNAVFSALAWRKDSSDLAALRSKKDKDFEGESNTVVAWKYLGPKKTIDAPAGKRIVGSRTPQWSEDGRMIFVGIADWDKKIEGKGEDDPSTVEVWHPKDFNVISEQKLRASRDRDRHVVAAWHVEDNRLVPLGTNNKETMQLPRAGMRAVAVDETPYESTAMFGRRFADVYKVDLATGDRSKVATKLVPPVWSSPGGKYALNFKEGEFWIYDLESGASRNVSKAAGVSFIDTEDDHPSPARSSWGIAGWTKDDGSVIVNGEFDLWELPGDGAKPRRLTDGASEHVRHRYANPEPRRQDPIDLTKPIYAQTYGVWTKKEGYVRIADGNSDRAVWLDRAVSGLRKAKNADVYTFVSNAFDVPPNVFAAGADLKDPKQVTDVNAFAKNYAWGKAQLIDYKSTKGERLQGALFYPANYEAGKKYPLIVHIYERESQFLHRYFPVSERSPYSEALWTSMGYFVLMPDIVFRPRNPGLSVLECVTAATRKVIDTGMIDAKRVGLVGHSWGGYGTSFVLTQTDLFSAGVAGGPLTNLSSSYGEIYWNNGVPETGHAEVGQERMEVPVYEDPASYLRNSATFHVQNMKGALLLAVGDKDGASDWHQDIEMYNLARRAGKQCIMLVYPGENHSLAMKANQMDYQRRILDWFDHYLKDGPAQSWITKGVTVLEREKELKRTKGTSREGDTTAAAERAPTARQ